MKELFLFILAPLVVVWFTHRLWMRAYGILRRDAKETAALRLAEEHPPFARAYAWAQKMAEYAYTGEAPWNRPERGPRSVYVLRGGK